MNNSTQELKSNNIHYNTKINYINKNNYIIINKNNYIIKLPN